MLLFVPGLEPCSSSAQGTEVSGSEPSLLCPVFELWVLLSGKCIRLLSSQIEWSKVTYIRPLSTTLWNPSLAKRTEASWISSARASLAREQASPASGEEHPTSDGSGRKSGASRSRRKRGGSSSRTSPASSALTVELRSRASSGTWHRDGGM